MSRRSASSIRGLDNVLPLHLLSFHTLPPALLSRSGACPRLIGRRPPPAHLSAANSPLCSAHLPCSSPPCVRPLIFVYLFLSSFSHLRYRPPSSFSFSTLSFLFLISLLSSGAPLSQVVYFLVLFAHWAFKVIFSVVLFSSSPLLSLFLPSHCHPFLFSLPCVCFKSLEFSLPTGVFFF